MADDTLQSGADTIATDHVTTLNGAAITLSPTTPKVQRVKVAFGDDGISRDSSFLFPFPVITPDVTAAGTISATDIVAVAPSGTGAPVSGASTAGSFVTLALPGGDSAWVLLLSGTFGGGTVWFESSINSTTGLDGSWTTLSCRTLGTATTVVGEGSTIQGAFRGNASGMAWARARITGATTPSVAVVMRAADACGPIALNAPLPAGTSMIGSVRPIASPTGTITSVVSATASTSLLAANANRLGAVFYNDSTATLFLALSATASTTAYTVQLAAGSFYELPDLGTIYTGAVTGIWSAANGSVKVTELT